jgi:hypothetical protein
MPTDPIGEVASTYERCLMHFMLVHLKAELHLHLHLQTAS